MKDGRMLDLEIDFTMELRLGMERNGNFQLQLLTDIKSAY